MLDVDLFISYACDNTSDNYPSTRVNFAPRIFTDRFLPKLRRVLNGETIERSSGTPEINWKKISQSRHVIIVATPDYHLFCHHHYHQIAKQVERLRTGAGDGVEPLTVILGHNGRVNNRPVLDFGTAAPIDFTDVYDDVLPTSPGERLERKVAMLAPVIAARLAMVPRDLELPLLATPPQPPDAQSDDRPEEPPW